MSRVLALTLLAALALGIGVAVPSYLSRGTSAVVPVAYDATSAMPHDVLIRAEDGPELRGGYSVDGRPVPDGFAGPQSTRWMPRSRRG